MSLLPKKKTPPAQKLTAYHVLIFGESGLGKSSLGAQFPNALFALTENSTKAMNVYSVNIGQKAKQQGKLRWEVFSDLVDEFIEGEHDFETLVIDTEDNLYDDCLEYITKQLGDHPGALDDFGASWSKLKDEFIRPHALIKSNGYGLVSISHAKFKEIEDLQGKKRDKLVPAVGGSSSEYLIDDSDIVILYDKDNEGNRVLRVNSDKNFTAKQRISTFPKEPIKAGSSAKEAYENFKDKFDNAIKDLNKELGITQEMIDDYYERKEKEDNKLTFKQLLNKVASKCSDKDIEKKEATKMIMKEYGKKRFSDLSYEQLEEFYDSL